MQRKNISINNLDITVDILGMGVLEDVNGMKNCVINVDCQIMMLNKDLSTEDSEHFYFIGREKIQLSEPDPEQFVPVKELNYELFLPIIQEKILNNERYLFLIQKFGSNMGLCEPPEVEVLKDMKKIDRRRTNAGIQYDENGYGMMYI